MYPEIFLTAAICILLVYGAFSPKMSTIVRGGTSQKIVNNNLFFDERSYARNPETENIAEEQHGTRQPANATLLAMTNCKTCEIVHYFLRDINR